MKKAQTYKVIGKAEARSDGAEKVTGKALYTVDVELPGMAHGKILRSPYAHARIRRVDGSKAEKLAGVYAVITRDDQKNIRMFGAAYKDQTVVAVDKARYAGDPVAAVAAVDEATANAALEMIEIDYQELPSVTSLDEAMAPGAPIITVTEAAAGKIRELLNEEGKTESGLRVFVQGGGCSGFQYGLMIEESGGVGDQQFESNGVRLFVDPVSISYLKGAEVDFVDTITGGGFTIKNPNATSTCGCGSSFSA